MFLLFVIGGGLGFLFGCLFIGWVLRTSLVPAYNKELSEREEKLRETTRQLIHAETDKELARHRIEDLKARLADMREQRNEALRMGQIAG